MWQWLLKKVIGYIVGKDIFGQIQDLVAEIALDDTLSGTQKREKVVAKAKEMGKDMKISAINLAVEAAVNLLDSEK